MKTFREDELVGLVKDWVRKSQRGADSAHVEIMEDSDVISSGLLDSMGFIELILFVETNTGVKIDLSDIDPNEFTTLRGLCKHVLMNGKSHHKNVLLDEPDC